MRVPAAIALIFAATVAFAAQFDDGDMERPDLGPWNVYGTPVTVEKSTQARSGTRALHVVTDNKDTMGGNFEGTSRALGEFQAGDVLRVSFWDDVRDSRNLVVGIGPSYFMGYWVFSGTDWTHADITFRCPQSGPYNIWLSQEDAPTEFYLDDFDLAVITRPQLGVAAADRRLSLTGGDLRLNLCRDTGALCGIENLATGEVYAPIGQRQPLFNIELLSTDGNGYETLPFQHARLEGVRTTGKAAADARFRLLDGALQLMVSVRLTPDGAAHFSGSLRNDSRRAVLSCELPVLNGLCPAADPGRLTLVHPTQCGQITPDALKSNGCQTTWPGQGAMGWMDLSGERGGVYLATHDPSYTGTRLMALPAPGPAFDMSLTREIVVKPGRVWQAPDAVVAVHQGDWHASADRYRAWARTVMQPPDVPRWLREADGWVLMGVTNGTPFWQIPDVFRSALWMGVDYLHVQGQGIDAMSADAQGERQPRAMTYLYPSPHFGTPAELKGSVRKIHTAGGHVMFYYLYERWTPSHSVSDDFGTGKRSDVPAPYLPPGPEFYTDNALVETPGGKPPTEQPLMMERIMCLAAPGWQEWMRHWAIDVYAREYAADGFYWDVMGRGGPFRCFNALHGHEGQNEWAAGCAKVLRTAIREGRRLNPDYSAAIEGCSDVLGQWNGFHLMSGATMTPNVFRYTFPGYLCVDGFSNTTWKLTSVEKAQRVFLDGERFDLHGYDQRVKKIINLRKRIKAFTDWPAVFEDTVGLSVSDDRVQARAFRRTDGGNRTIAVTMMNQQHATGATVTVVLSPIGAASAVYLFTLDGRVQPLQPQGGKTQAVSVPADDISAALIVGAVSPELAVVPWLEQMMSPGNDGLALTAFYPAGRRDAPTAALEGGPSRTLQRRELAGESPCLQRWEYTDPGHLQSLRRWERVTATLAWGARRAAVWTILAPPLVNGDFEEIEDGRLVYWGVPPCAEDPGQGRHCIRVDTQTAPLGHLTSLTPIKPGCRYRLRCLVKRSARATGWAGAHLVEYEEGNQFVRSAVLNSTKLGEWETLETEFTSHADPRSSAIYLYNFDDREPAWFDGIELEEIR